MSSYISLRDITTEPEHDELEAYEFVNNDNLLDEIEFCLGLERGDITKYSGTDLNRAELRSDMLELLKEGQWALIPSREDLKIMRDLYLDNHEKGTYHRTKFTDAIPIQPFYEYRFMGVEQPGKSFHARSEPYESPYSDFPIIRTTLHPCFVFPSLAHCVAWGSLSGMEHLTLLGDDAIMVYYADHALNMFVYLSFLGNTLASDFPGRRIPCVFVDCPLVKDVQPKTAAAPESGPTATAGPRDARRVRIQPPSASSGSSKSSSRAKAPEILRSKRSEVSTEKKKETAKSRAHVPRKSTPSRSRSIPQTSSSTNDGAPPQRRRSARLASK